MPGLLAFLRCVGKAAFKNAGKAIASLIPGGEAAFEIARDACEEFVRIHSSPNERPLVVPALAGSAEQDRLKPGLQTVAAIEDKAPIVLRSAQRSYTLHRLMGAGDVADSYFAAAPGDTGMEASTRFIVEVARAPEGDRLLENERRIVSYLCSRAGNSTYRPYLRTLMESFRLDVPGGRRVNVFRHEPGFWTLEQVHEQHPALDGRHLAWIFKRLLTVLGFCHRQGRIHGAVLPGHVLIHAGNHGLQLIGWGQSVASGTVQKNIAPKWSDWYPPETRKKQPARVATDLFLAARCMVYLAGGDPLGGRMPDTVPPPMQRFIATCLFPPVAMRPDDAWKLMDEFDRLLHKLYGPPMFHPLTMNGRRY